jgi:hypothetical protein
VKLDLGCGTKKREGFIGVDSRAFDGVDVVCNLGVDAWPWADDVVEEVYCAHMLEHLTAAERIHFVNELHRVMKKGAKASIIVPHWGSSRAYGDLTHQWPPVVEFWFYYLTRSWREDQAPHSDFYTCDFDVTWGYGMHPSLLVRNQEYQQFALNFYREAAQDIHAALTKRG